MKTILILAATFAAFATSPALAQSAAGSSRVAVSYADLDLSTANGVRTLDRRIRTAVETACGPTSDSDPRGKNQILQCRADTLAFARAQRDSAMATAPAPSRTQLASRR